MFILFEGCEVQIDSRQLVIKLCEIVSSNSFLKRKGHVCLNCDVIFERSDVREDVINFQDRQHAVGKGQLQVSNKPRML